MKNLSDAKLLIVDDNRELLSLIAEELESAGYRRLFRAESAAAARRVFESVSPDLVILDINLPDGDGFSLFGEFRRLSDSPILFLSARDADSDRLFGLGLGADDYLTKPFLMQELLLRIRLILRRCYRERAPLVLGEAIVHTEDALVVRGSETLPLTATEQKLLSKLADSRGHIVTYDALCEAIWGASYYSYENSLGVHIRHLREKIETDPSHPRWLVTARGIGYKLRKEEDV